MTVAGTDAADTLEAAGPLALGLTAEVPFTGALGDVAARVRLAAHPGTPQHLLQHLAVDAEVMVRAAVAMNRAATPALLAILTTDGDERVRALLAAKIAHLLPGLAGGSMPRRRSTYARPWPSWWRTRRCASVPPSPTPSRRCPASRAS